MSTIKGRKGAEAPPKDPAGATEALEDAQRPVDTPEKAAAVLMAELEVAIKKTAPEMLPGGQYEKREDYVVHMMAREYKTTVEYVRKMLNDAVLDIQAQGADGVLCTVPKSFKLQLNHHKQIDIQEGVRRLPVSIADHWWSKTNGVKRVSESEAA